MRERKRKLVLVSRSGGIYEPSSYEDTLVSNFVGLGRTLLPNLGWYFKVINEPNDVMREWQTDYDVR